MSNLTTDSLIINPMTNRPIKIGGPTWAKLVKKGIIEQRPDSHELYQIKPDDDVDNKIRELDKILPHGEQAVRGRGKYANRIVKRSMRIKPNEMAQHASKVASKIAPTLYNLEIDEDELSSIMEKMILAEMIKPVKKEKPLVSYQIDEVDEVDEGDEGDEGDEESDEESDEA